MDHLGVAIIAHALYDWNTVYSTHLAVTDRYAFAAEAVARDAKSSAAFARWSRERSPEWAQDVAYCFHYLDLDRSDSIDLDEVRVALRTFGLRLSREDIAEWWASATGSADPDSAAALCFDDFARVVSQVRSAAAQMRTPASSHFYAVHSQSRAAASAQCMYFHLKETDAARGPARPAYPAITESFSNLPPAFPYVTNTTRGRPSLSCLRCPSAAADRAFDAADVLSGALSADSGSARAPFRCKAKSRTSDCTARLRAVSAQEERASRRTAARVNPPPAVPQFASIS
jgi:hypothetical protein